MIQYMKELGMELKEIKEIRVPERVQGSLVSGSKKPQCEFCGMR